mmetsp:Transcript_47700/g.137348  ORF Transcript_47700/g.137348 Transcript_47700/m.137348 type:complete len:285 (-) Transcript_47700:372-1226(-)
MCHLALVDVSVDLRVAGVVVGLLGYSGRRSVCVLAEVGDLLPGLQKRAAPRQRTVRQVVTCSGFDLHAADYFAHRPSLGLLLEGQVLHLQLGSGDIDVDLVLSGLEECLLRLAGGCRHLRKVEARLPQHLGGSQVAAQHPGCERVVVVLNVRDLDHVRPVNLLRPVIAQLSTAQWLGLLRQHLHAGNWLQKVLPILALLLQPRNLGLQVSDRPTLGRLPHPEVVMALDPRIAEVVLRAVGAQRWRPEAILNVQRLQAVAVPRPEHPGGLACGLRILRGCTGFPG